MLNVESLIKVFGDKTAVNNLSFQMDTPGVFGLIGTNGAGKTTAIRCILGIMTADSGRAVWNGKPISRETLDFGYMPEERGIYMKNKVLDQLIYFGMLRGMSRLSARNAAVGYMERLGVQEYQNMDAEKLSKGNQQKIQLIATLIHNPKLVFLDEPFSGLDPVNADLLRSLIGELVEEGKYIIMSSHQMEIVENYCHDIAILNRGKTVLQGNLNHIKNSYGHTNLLVSAAENIDLIAQRAGLKLIEKRPSETEYHIEGDDMAKLFLNLLIAEGIYPSKYEIKEPSLHEIFVERVGVQQ